MDRKAFHDAIRPKIGALTQANVEGFERYLDEGWQRNTALDRLAYIIATVFWETARTMTPVKEGYYLGSKAEAFRRKLRYYPWYGRGDIQLTWEENYRKAGDAIGVDLIKNPDAALDPKNAVKIAFAGMEGGWFTGKAVSDYLDGIDEGDDEDLREFANARRVVNGTDKQIEIGQLALTFEHALRVSGYSALGAPVPTPRPEQTPVEVAPPPPVDAIAEPTTAKPPKTPTPVAQANKAVGAGKWTALGTSIWSAIVISGVLPAPYDSPEFATIVSGILATVVAAIGAYRASPNARI